ncbi:MAG: YbaK/EbsC family protein [Alphaproteobacteria bacterium]|nr:MAG: YbaK/EbsC family protein [Alphaproteobacteria bacterium]
MTDLDNPLPSNAQRVAETARELGLSPEIVTMANSTRTAEEAAAACRCDVGQIVKSLVFRGATSGTPYLLLVSGKNRVNEREAAKVIGEALARPDAAYVRATTGYAIGGIPPFGHDIALRTFIDADLLDYADVWAAAGTPHCVMRLNPRDLQAKTGAVTIYVY